MHAALENHGWLLARGDKQTADGKSYLMVIDPHGGTHELRRRVDKVKAAQSMRAWRTSIPPSLPSIDEARVLQKIREVDRSQSEQLQPVVLSPQEIVADRQSEKEPERGIPTSPPVPENAPEPTVTRPILVQELETAKTAAAEETKQMEPERIAGGPEFDKAAFDATEPDAKATRGMATDGIQQTDDRSRSMDRRLSGDTGEGGANAFAARPGRRARLRVDDFARPRHRPATAARQ